MISPAAPSASTALAALREPGAAPVASARFSAPELALASGLPAREVRKLDRFSLLAVAAARRALEDAGLTPEGRRPCGVVTGNMLAGWTFTEPQLQALHASGPQAVSPYLATAWFPAAPQGQITIHLGLTGFAKTVTTDRCSGAQAIALAFERVRHGQEPLLLAGGVEAPLTPLVETGIELSQEVAGPLSEGGAYVLLAAEPSRGPALALHATRPAPPEGPARALRELLEELAAMAAGLPPLGAVLVDLPQDRDLEEVVSAWLDAPRWGDELEVFFPGSLFGETLAASSALSFELARQWMLQAGAPASAAVVTAGPCTIELLWLVNEPT